MRPFVVCDGLPIVYRCMIYGCVRLVREPLPGRLTKLVGMAAAGRADGENDDELFCSTYCITHPMFPSPEVDTEMRRERKRKGIWNKRE